MKKKVILGIISFSHIFFSLRIFLLYVIFAFYTPHKTFINYLIFLKIQYFSNILNFCTKLLSVVSFSLHLIRNGWLLIIFFYFDLKMPNIFWFFFLTVWTYMTPNYTTYEKWTKKRKSPDIQIRAVIISGKWNTLFFPKITSWTHNMFFSRITDIFFYKIKPWT